MGTNLAGLEMMEPQHLLAALRLPEDREWEFKSAAGGLPRNLWETYSAFANTQGGTIILGIREVDECQVEIQGLDDIPKLKTNFWNGLNNPQKVNECILKDEDVREVHLNGKVVLVIHVPRASRNQRPIYLANNPHSGTFKRNHDGDYLCKRDEVARMFADQSVETSASSRILPLFTMADLDDDSIRQYRNRFSAHFRNNHAWLNDDINGFLRKIHAWGVDRQSGSEGPTLAGLLMFGTEQALMAQEAGVVVPLDYRERVSNRISDRWHDRLVSDGTWTPNLFQFFNKVFPKLVEGLKLPFSYQNSDHQNLFSDPLRRGLSPAHESIQEALVNALVHADYHGQGGIIIERFPDRLELANPGTLLVSLEELEKGTVSQSRNPLLQTMFRMIGAGDSAGSGMDKIRTGWRDQKFRAPLIEEVSGPDRVRLVMPLVSLLPFPVVEYLRSRFDNTFEGLNGAEVQALVTAYLEGGVRNQRLQQLSTDHTADISKMLQDLVVKNCLVKEGSRRWTVYRLPPVTLTGEGALSESSLVGAATVPDPLPMVQRVSGTPDIEESSGRKASGTPDAEEESSGRKASGGWDTFMGTNSDLRRLVDEIRGKNRVSVEKMRKMILGLCQGRRLTALQIGLVVNRNAERIRKSYLTPMVQSGELKMVYSERNNPDQAYTASEDVISVEAEQ